MKKLMATASAALVAMTGSGALAHGDDDSRRSATPVTECGTVIEKPGLYFLAEDIIGCGADVAIEIRASWVVLVLRSRTISGIGAGIGIFVNGRAGALRHVAIRGRGVVHGFDVGVRFEHVRESEVEEVTATANRFGFVVGRVSEPEAVPGHRVGREQIPRQHRHRQLS